MKVVNRDSFEKKINHPFFFPQSTLNRQKTRYRVLFKSLSCSKEAELNWTYLSLVKKHNLFYCPSPGNQVSPGSFLLCNVWNRPSIQSPSDDIRWTNQTTSYQLKICANILLSLENRRSSGNIRIQQQQCSETPVIKMFAELTVTPFVDRRGHCLFRQSWQTPWAQSFPECVISCSLLSCIHGVCSRSVHKTVQLYMPSGNRSQLRRFFLMLVSFHLIVLMCGCLFFSVSTSIVPTKIKMNLNLLTGLWIIAFEHSANSETWLDLFQADSIWPTLWSLLRCRYKSLGQSRVQKLCLICTNTKIKAEPFENINNTRPVCFFYHAVHTSIFRFLWDIRNLPKDSLLFCIPVRITIGQKNTFMKSNHPKVKNSVDTKQSFLITTIQKSVHVL